MMMTMMMMGDESVMMDDDMFALVGLVGCACVSLLGLLFGSVSWGPAYVAR